MEFCTNCKKDVETFSHKYSTLPQDEKNEVRRYDETFCKLCGHCIDSKKTDEIATDT